MIWYLVGYMWLFLHRPFEVWTWMGTLRVERVYMIITLIAWLTMAEKQLTENKINFAVVLFALAMTVSTVMSPYTNPIDSGAYQDWLKYLVFYVLVMTSVKTEKDLKILITAFLMVFFIYMLHSYREYLNGRYDWAMGTRRMIGVDSTMSNPNGFGASIVIMLPMLLPFLALIKKKWWYLFVLAYFLLSVRCVQLTGSRSSLATLFLCLGVAAIISKRRFIYIPTMALGAVILWASMTDNLRDRYMSLIDPTINESANQSAEGRLDGFLEGLDNWASSPIWGVGPDCHGYAAGTGFLSHCLYGQIPGELGSLGVLAFLMLLACFFLNHLEIIGYYHFLKRHKKEEEALYCYRVSLSIIASVFLMLFFGLSGHNGYRYTWIWIAAYQAVACHLLQVKVDAIRKVELYGPETPLSISSDQSPSMRRRIA